MAVTTHSHDVIPAQLPVADTTRPRLLVLATSLASAAVAMGFVGLLSVYIAERADVIQTGERWLPNGVDIPLTQPNYIGLTIAFSVITIWWMVSAIRNDDRTNALAATAISLLFGFAYFAQTAFLMTIMEIEIAADPRGVLLYAIIVTHMVMMVVAIGYVLLMSLRAAGGDYSSQDYEGVLSAAIFWTVTSGLYAVMWYVIYITK